MIKKLTITMAFVFALGLASLAGFSATTFADGNGSPAGCLNGPSVEGNEDELTFNAGSGNVVDGVCIKSGSNMFGGNQHSNVLGNGTYENGCYQVEGVGTQTVTVTRLLSGPSCQGLSHIDVIVGEAPKGEDVCLNIEGDQSEVPEGLIRDEHGNCVAPPELDVCPNIEGDQSRIPDGMVKDDQDNCVTPPSGVTLGEQVEVPTGAVKAGSGGVGNSTPLVAAGLVGSLAALGYGLLRLRGTDQ